MNEALKNEGNDYNQVTLPPISSNKNVVIQEQLGETI